MKQIGARKYPSDGSPVHRKAVHRKWMERADGAGGVDAALQSDASTAVVRAAPRLRCGQRQPARGKGARRVSREVSVVFGEAAIVCPVQSKH